jgi:hypothetical protein
LGGKKMKYKDVFEEFAVWSWGKIVPTEVKKLRRFIIRSPIGRYILTIEKENYILRSSENMVKGEFKDDS